MSWTNIADSDKDTFTGKDLKRMAADIEDDDLIYFYCIETGKSYGIVSSSSGVFLNGKRHEKGGYLQLLGSTPPSYPQEKRE